VCVCVCVCVRKRASREERVCVYMHAFMQVWVDVRGCVNVCLYYLVITGGPIMPCRSRETEPFPGEVSNTCGIDQLVKMLSCFGKASANWTK
jgi:hypothetical protein